MCAVSWATWLLLAGVLVRCVVLWVRCSGPLGSCSPVCPPLVLWCPFVSAVSWATWHMFTGVLARCVVFCLQCPGPLGSCSRVCPLGVLCCLCGWLDHLAPVYRCARSVRCVMCAAFWATWLLFTGVSAPCVVLRVRCPGPLAFCLTVCSVVALCCVCGVLGHSAPVPARGVLVPCCVCAVLGHVALVHRCARSVCCVLCAVSRTHWLLFTGVPPRCVVLCVQCPKPLGSCSPVCPLCGLRCVCVVLGHWAPVHRCACSVRCDACASSWATWLLLTGVAAECGVLRVRCPGPLGSCSSVCPLGVLCCLCGYLDYLAPDDQCACSVRCVMCAASWATWLLFTGVSARCVVLRVRCPVPLGSCLTVCLVVALCCVCGVLGHWAPVHRCARPCRCGLVLLVPCPGSLGTCSPMCSLGALCSVSSGLGPLAPVHCCARSVCSVACAVTCDTWLMLTGVPAPCAVLCVQRPGPPGSFSPVCSFRALRCFCTVLGHLAPVHR